MSGNRWGGSRASWGRLLVLVAISGAVVVSTGAVDLPDWDTELSELEAVGTGPGGGRRRVEPKPPPDTEPPPTSETEPKPPPDTEPPPTSTTEPPKPPDTEPPPTSGGGGSACGSFPRFPNETCTGWKHTGVTLRECPNEITEPGTTLDGCRFVGGLGINAADVTITRSRIEGLVSPRDDLQNLTLVDVEIDGTGRVDPASPDGQLAIGSSNYTCIRCHIHGTGRGANLTHNVRIEDSYLHGFPYMNGKHMTAIGSNGGTNHIIRHNNLECDVSGCSAALSFYGDFAQVKDVLIEHNLFNTTGSYCTYAGSVNSKPYPNGTNVRYLDNLFGKKFMPDCGRYGPVTSWNSGGGNVWQGNAWQDGSGPVEP